MEAYQSWESKKSLHMARALLEQKRGLTNDRAESPEARISRLRVWCGHARNVLWVLKTLSSLDVSSTAGLAHWARALSPRGSWAGSLWGLPPRAPADPDVHVKRIRFVRLRGSWGQTSGLLGRVAPGITPWSSHRSGRAR